MSELLIIGANGHGKVVADIAVNMGIYEKISFLDDNEEIISVLGFPCKGKVSLIEREDRKCHVVVAIGNPKIREKILERVMKLGFEVPVLIHPNAVVADDVQFGCGCVVMAGAVINCSTTIGKGSIVNTACSVDHDCIMEDYSHVAVGAHLAGTVHVGKRTWVGAGAVVSNNINICDDVMIGAGAAVVKDILEPGTYVGVPVKKLK